MWFSLKSSTEALYYLTVVDNDSLRGRSAELRVSAQPGNARFGDAGVKAEPADLDDLLVAAFAVRLYHKFGICEVHVE